VNRKVDRALWRQRKVANKLRKYEPKTVALKRAKREAGIA